MNIAYGTVRGHTNKNTGLPTMKSDYSNFSPKLVFWETTNACNLKCIHCRARPADTLSPDELRLDEAFALINELASFESPALVLSGGEPLVRPDIFEIASYGSSRGLRVLLATNGTLITQPTAEKIAESGIKRVSVSIDGADAKSHDAFRKVEGAFERAWQGIEHLKSAGVPFQINTTVSKHNLEEIPRILEMAKTSDAAALHIFLLVPTGCGKEIADEEMIEPRDYEQVLNWIYDRSKDSQIELKATCAPHYQRIIRQRAKNNSETTGAKGCLGGTSVCFVSYKGDVYPCGYLPVSAGNIREKSFVEIWKTAEVFRLLRDEDNLRGKCGVCEYRRVCMGCRARAYAYTGDYLAEEPFCIYTPEYYRGAREKSK
jgi:heme b synthase